MNLLEKIESNLKFIFEKREISDEEWRRRFQEFGDNQCYVWFGIDSEGNLAEFTSDALSYVPESFFFDNSANKKLLEFFGDLPGITETLLPENLSLRLKKVANNKRYNTFWETGADDGLFKFEQTNGDEWNKTFDDFIENNRKPPYELLLIPKEPLKAVKLPEEIQNLLESYQFKNLRFEDCQFLDVSKYLYCEK